jgi:cell wall-associated NlpC family hydrolase
MHRARRVIAVAVAVVAALAAAAPAGADPVGDKQREATRIAQRVDQLGDKAADLGEEYNGARIALDGATQQVASTEGRVRDLESKLGTVRSEMGAFAVRQYIYADQTVGFVGLLSGTSLTEGAAQRAGYTSLALGAKVDLTDDAKALLEDMRRQQAVLTVRRDVQAKLAKRMADAKQAAEKAMAAQQDLLGKVKGELASLVQSEREQRARASAALTARLADTSRVASRASAPEVGASPGAARPVPASPADAGAGSQDLRGATPAATTAAPVQAPAPAMSAGAAAAVRAAVAQVGKPYRFAGGGPDAFDCSGLTMFAWARAGVSLPHFARAQWESLPRVSLKGLQPGDLVFFYADVHHVGLYIGGGMMVHAPRTGEVVSVAPIGPSVIGAARP